MQILKFNKEYQFYNSFESVKCLPNTVLNLDCDPFGNHFLTEGEGFKLPSKIYSNDRDFIEHVTNVYKLSEKSVGVLLKGKKGLGKSFTSKVICQALNLPVINISKATSDNMFDFLNKIEQEHIVYIDEFEKLFPTNPKDPEDVIVKQDKFLSFLDGSTTTNTKRLFIITANSDVNEFLINRPSRIRYLRNYLTIHPLVVEEIILDKLSNKEFKADLIDHLDIEELNVDSLIEIINEINISQKPYSTFKDFFNYQVTRAKYDLYIINDGLVGNFVGSKFLTETHVEGLKTDNVYQEFGDDDEHYITKFLQEDNIGNLIFSGYCWVDGEDKNDDSVKVSSQYLVKRNFSKLSIAV